MRPARVSTVIAAAAALVVAVSALVRTQPASTPLGAGEDITPTVGNPVRVTVVVTNVRDAAETSLKPGDFQLFDDGVPQAIERVEPPPSKPPARDIALVLDEYHVRAEDTARVRAALTRFVDEDVRPDDVVTVLKPLESLIAIRPSRDRDEVRRAIGDFEGRMGDYTPRTPFESTYMGRDPAMVEAMRSQIVLSMLSALTSSLGDHPETRKTILLVSDGFAPRFRARRDGGLPDIKAVIRGASIFNVGISIVSPDADADTTAADADAATLRALADGAAGTWFGPSQDLFGALHRTGRDLDASYTLTYQPQRADDGRFHAIEVRVKADGAHVRARAGYAVESIEQTRLAAAHATPVDVLPARMQHKSNLIKPWFGMTRGADGRTHVTFTWEPAASPAANRPRPETIVLTATTTTGDQLFSGSVSPVGITGAAPALAPEQASFDAPAGTIQLDMRIEGGDEKVLDLDVRDIAVASLAGAATVMTEPEVLRTRTARQWAAIVGDASAPPVASRIFSRTERLLIRVPAYGPGQTPATVTATLQSVTGQAMRTLPVMAAPAPGVTQFDLPLAPYAPGDYAIALTATSPAGQARETFAFTITD